jgi:hypothetical protein
LSIPNKGEDRSVTNVYQKTRYCVRLFKKKKVRELESRKVESKRVCYVFLTLDTIIPNYDHTIILQIVGIVEF